MATETKNNGPAGDAKAAVGLLASLDGEAARAASLFDRDAAFQAVAATIPRLTGMDTALVGELKGGNRDQVVLRVVKGPRPTDSHRWAHPLDGLVIPRGLGVGGVVLASGRPHGVSDYCRSATITHEFDAHARAAGLRGVIAVPVAQEGEIIGLLYGASSHREHVSGRRLGAMVDAAQRAANAAVVAERARHAAEVAVYEERRRLALELHDSLGAILFAIGARVRKLEDDPGLPADMRARLSQISRQAAEAGDTLRHSLRAMHTPAEALALDVALRADCRAFSARSSIPARLVDLTGVAALSRSRTQALIQAVREALLNIEKHARARAVVVTVAVRRGQVTVTVVDDGIGLESTLGVRALGEGPGTSGRGVWPAGGLGLAAAAEGLARVGGGMAVGDNEEGGVTVRAWVVEAEE